MASLAAGSRHWARQPGSRHRARVAGDPAPGPAAGLDRVPRTLIRYCGAYCIYIRAGQIAGYIYIYIIAGYIYIYIYGSRAGPGRAGPGRARPGQVSINNFII